MADDAGSLDTLVKYLKALVLLQVRVMSGGTASAKPEVLLSKAGFTHKEIADLLGKKADAVRKVISRSAIGAGGDDNE